MTITNRLAALAAFAIGATVFASAASAHCARHVYNNSSRTWHVLIEPSSYPNRVDHDVAPGATLAFQHVTGQDDPPTINLWTPDVAGKPPRKEGQYDYYAQYLVLGCTIQHSASNRIPQIILNDPADGDVQLVD